MKATRIFKATALTSLLLAGTAGTALAQDQLVSGEPYFGFFEGVTIQANGPVITEERATEAPSRLVQVEGRSILLGQLNATELAGLNPEAFLGLPEVETNGNLTAIAKVSMGLPEAQSGEEISAIANRIIGLVKGWVGADQTDSQ
jgi:hypothetical protein